MNTLHVIRVYNNPRSTYLVSKTKCLLRFRCVSFRRQLLTNHTPGIKITMECRIARASDKSRVLEAFPGIYGGLDYVTSDYDYFMACPRCTCYIGEIDGRIVAFMSTKLLDENRAYVIKSERVHVDYRGRGLINQLTTYANHCVTKHLVGPKIHKKIAYRATDENMKKLERHPEREIIGKRLFLLYTVNIEEMGQMLAKDLGSSELDIVEIHSLTNKEKNEIKKYFTSYCQASQGVMCVYYTPYGNCEDNWDDVLENTSWLVTQRSGLQGKGKQFQDVILVKSRKCEVGMRCDIEIVSAERHLAAFIVEKMGSVLKMIQSKMQHLPGTVTFWIFCAEQYIEEMNVKVARLLAQKDSVTPVTVLHVAEELKI